MADPIETVKALDIDAMAREAGASTYTNRHAPGTAFAFGPDTWAAFKASLLSQMQALPEKGQAEHGPFLAWANAAGYDTAHTYDTERSRWLFLNPMTADLWVCWQAALASQAERREPLSDAVRDAERLDWVERQDLDDLVFGLVKDAPHDGEYVVNAGAGPRYGKTLRAAIDAAMGITRSTS